MRNLLSLIQKDFIIFWRSKASLAAMLLAPLLVVLIVGAGFSSSQLSGVKLGIYSPSYTNLTNSVIQSFQTKDYEIQKYKSVQECINSVKNAETQLCVVFPPNMTIKGSQRDVNIYADHSQMNLAYTLINDIEASISSKASKLGVTLTNEIIKALQEAKEKLEIQKSELLLLKDKSETLSDQAKDINSTLSDIQDSISKLKDAKEIAENLNTSEDLVKKIDSALDTLEDVKDSKTGLGGNVKDLSSQAEELSSKISEEISRIDHLLKTLSGPASSKAEQLVSPIKTNVQSINSKSTNWDYLFPTLLSIFLLFSSLLLASTLAYRGRHSKAYFRNFISPTKDATFIMGTFITCILVLIIQFILVFASAMWIMHMPIQGSLLRMSLILFLGALFFIPFGILIGYTFKSEETVILLTIFIAAFLLFFSNTILPIQTISKGYQEIAAYNPLVIVNSMLKKITLFNLPLSSFSGDIYLLIIGAIILTALSIFERKVIKRLS